MLRFMGSQRVGQDWVTELNSTQLEQNMMICVKPTPSPLQLQACVYTHTHTHTILTYWMNEWARLTVFPHYLIVTLSSSVPLPLLPRQQSVFYWQIGIYMSSRRGTKENEKKKKRKKESAHERNDMKNAFQSKFWMAGNICQLNSPDAVF